MAIKGKMETDRRKELLRLSQKVADILKKDYHVKRVFLIGSLVRGGVHEKSDIDIVVEGLAPEHYIKALSRIYDVLPPGVELNLIPFEDAFESLKKKTVEKGMLIHG